ncbi:methyltransferase domain-containing protein [Streptomyces sp. NA02950]|uniref:class I SAM-dependent methyltransferase n=1 Tax=Streptomyces sp. NA02950 TaxID=2742137 RepID=UPI0015908157|nr:class I SAM-dependent methyltransferase [Streptomyces sp. NA02950]QKV94160.1 methyltransferase domain-containing protein [Streptomyces sp. NA02950]
MPHAPMTRAEYWDKYKPCKSEGTQPAPRADRFDWTQYPGHGPGAEVLEDPHRALELGPAEGKEAAHLARQGVDVTGIDFSLVQVARARAWWHDTPGLSFVHAEACAYLASTPAEYDAIYSVWGAVWFTDPEDLFPYVLKRLAPGGVFAFSHAEPVTGSYGPQQMRGKWLEGRERELTVLRWQYAPEMWADILKRHGFTDIDAHVLKAPEPGSLGTLMVRAHVPA